MTTQNIRREASGMMRSAKITSPTARSWRMLVTLLLMLLTATTAGAWEGQGNEASPYLIKTNADLNQLATDVNNATNLYEGVYFRLENDLDYGGGTSTNYTPIGNDVYDHTFRGYFNGNGKTIRGIRIYSNGGEYLGIFGSVYRKGCIYDLTVSDAIITGHSKVGGIVGFLRSGTVSRCHVTSDVKINADNSYYAKTSAASWVRCTTTAS